MTYIFKRLHFITLSRVTKHQYFYSRSFMFCLARPHRVFFSLVSFVFIHDFWYVQGQSISLKRINKFYSNPNVRNKIDFKDFFFFSENVRNFSKTEHISNILHRFVWIFSTSCRSEILTYDKYILY